MRLKRRYTSVRFYCFSYDMNDENNTARDQLVRVAKHFGRDISVFTLNVIRGSGKLIVKLLKHMPNIVNLRIDLQNTKKCSMAPVTLNKLQNLWVGERSETVFSLLVAPELQKLHFNGFFFTNGSLLENFLQVSPKFQYLNITLENLKGSRYPFRLKTLVAFAWDENVTVGDATKTIKFERIKDFPLSQAEIVEICQFINFDTEMYRNVLPKFQRLKYISFRSEKFVCEEINSEIRPMRNLKN